MDGNIKVFGLYYFAILFLKIFWFFAFLQSMYQLMAKCEELSKSMTPIYKQAEQV